MSTPVGIISEEKLRSMAADHQETYTFIYDGKKLSGVLISVPVVGSTALKKVFVALPYEHILHLAEEIKKRSSP